MFDALTRSERNLTGTHPDSLRIRLELVGILLDHGNITEARHIMDGINEQPLQTINEIEPLRVQYLTDLGRLSIKTGNKKEGLQILEEALMLSRQIYSESSYKTRELERELPRYAGSN
jgi:hypothetical protein